MKIDLPNLRDTRYLLIQIGILGTANCLKNILFFNFVERLVSIEYLLK